MTYAFKGTIIKKIQGFSFSKRAKKTIKKNNQYSIWNQAVSTVIGAVLVSLFAGSLFGGET